MRFVQLLILLAVMAAPVRAESASETWAGKALVILRQKFPDAAFVADQEAGQQAGRLLFALKTREFTLYSADKTGAWQAPHQDVGPDRGGFLVRVSVHEGPWVSALMLPHARTEDLYVFQRSRVIRQAKDGKSYLWAEVSNPRFMGNAELRDQLVALFNTFE